MPRVRPTPRPIRNNPLWLGTRPPRKYRQRQILKTRLGIPRFLSMAHLRNPPVRPHPTSPSLAPPLRRGRHPAKRDPDFQPPKQHSPRPHPNPPQRTRNRSIRLPRRPTSSGKFSTPTAGSWPPAFPPLSSVLGIGSIVELSVGSLQLALFRGSLYKIPTHGRLNPYL